MPRTLSSEKRDRFLTAALNLFVEKGVQNTSTADISKEAGTAAGTLFLYFPTKQDLLDALLLKISREQADATNARLEPDLSARDSLWAIWDSSVRWLRDHMQAYLFVEQVRDTGLITQAVVQETAGYFAYYYTAIQKGLAEGSIQPYPPDLIGGFLYQDIVATMNLIRAQPDPVQQEEIIRQGFAIFWNGIKTRN